MQTSCVYGHPAGSKAPWMHMLDPIASSFHIENFQVKNIPWWVSLIPCYNGAGLKKLSLKLHSGVVWNVCLLEAEGKNWAVDQALFVETHCFESFSWVPFCEKIWMQINADWKGTSNEHPWWHANEVNVSTINMMNKMTLTWVKCSKHPCFLLTLLFVLFSPREPLQCGTSSPCRGQISWFK